MLIFYLERNDEILIDWDEVIDLVVIAKSYQLARELVARTNGDDWLNENKTLVKQIGVALPGMGEQIVIKHIKYS